MVRISYISELTNIKSKFTFTQIILNTRNTGVFAQHNKLSSLAYHINNTFSGNTLPGFLTQCRCMEPEVRESSQLEMRPSGTRIKQN